MSVLVTSVCIHNGEARKGYSQQHQGKAVLYLRNYGHMCDTTND